MQNMNYKLHTHPIRLTLVRHKAGRLVSGGLPAALAVTLHLQARGYGGGGGWLCVLLR